MNHFRNGAIAFMFLAVMLLPGARAEAATIEEMLTQIKTLMTQIEELQKQLSTIRGEVQEILKEGLTEGTTDDDIKKIQELLATDPTIYPEGKTTGYFGPLTKEALKRFQLRHELEVSGTLDDATRALLEEYLHEGFVDTIPAGLLQAPGIAKKIEMRYELKCEDEDEDGAGVLCKKLKVKYKVEDDGEVELEVEEEDDENEDEDEDEDEDDDEDEDSDDSDDDSEDDEDEDEGDDN